MPSLVETTRSASNALLELLLPPCCVGCGASLADTSHAKNFCDECRKEIFSSTRSTCERCALPLAATGRCAICATKSPPFQAAVALGMYGGGLRNTILRMKSAFHEPLAAALGCELGRRSRDFFQDSPPEVVVPVPSPWLRRLHRGTSSPATLARFVAKIHNIRLGDRVVRCLRNPLQQSTLPTSKRQKNIRGAFGLSSTYDIKGIHVLIVDDVYTTGATLGEITGLLLKSGAARVSVAVVARALPDPARNR